MGNWRWNKLSDNNKLLASILIGLGNINRIDLIEEIAKPFIAKGERLSECITPFTISPLASRELLHEAKDRAIEVEDRHALNLVILAAIINFEANPSDLHTLFIPAIEKLTGLYDSAWINEVWHKEESIRFLNTLNRDVAIKILNNLIPLNELGFHAEWVIEPIAEKHPDLVLDFFGSRLDIEKEKSTGYRYDAIPYSFEKLNTPLSAHPVLVVEAAFLWHQRSPELFQYRGANLISNTFPEFNDKLEEKLLQLVRTKQEEELKFVTSILRNYKGEKFLHAICREIILAVDGKGPIAREVEFILEESGVLHGEFGFVERCQQKKKEIQYWCDDPKQVVRDFAKKYIRSLDRQRAAEQRRAEEDMELRKHQYK